MKDFLKGVTPVISTSGRVDIKLQQTLKNLPSFITEKIIVTCPKVELEPLKKLIETLDIKVAGVMGIDHNNLSELRNLLINKLKRNVLFIDDNMNFHAREYSDIGGETKYLLKGLNDKYFSKQLQEKLFYEMFGWITEKLNSGHFGMVGLSSRAGNNFIKTEEVYNNRICAFWGVNYDNYIKAGSPDLGTISTKQDFFLELSFLKAGIPCVKTSTFAYDKCGGSNAKGGCSRYRDIDRMDNDSRKLVECFPQNVSIVIKDASKWSNLDGETFNDVKIGWKKAYSGKPVEEIVGYKNKDSRTKENYKK